MAHKDPEVRRAYRREYCREWTRRRRDAYFADKVCAKCGTGERLELDHIDWRTKESHNIWSWSQERRDAELAKCQVLCHGCHKAKTWTIDLPEQGRCTPTEGVAHHGTWGRYRRGCRCGLCRLKNINYKRDRKVVAA